MSISLSPLLPTLQHALEALATSSPGPDTLVVAYSGGVDSTVLLHALCELSKRTSLPRLIAFHVNHGLSIRADAWQKHCKTIAESLGVTFESVKLTITAKPRTSLEDSARQLRYQALLSACQMHNGALLLGHHQDDQLETLLLQLKRGAGPKGLSGMGPLQVKSGIRLLRPWLAHSRAELESYATEQSLNWIEDESNRDDRFDRNFLRNQILPVLQSRWPAIAATASRSAALCAEQTLMLEEEGRSRLVSLVNEEGCLSVADTAAYSLPWQKLLVRLWLEQQQVPAPSQAILEQILGVFTARVDSEPLVEWQGWQVRRFNQYLYLLPREEVICPDSLVIMAGQPTKLPWLGGELTVLCNGLQALMSKPDIHLVMGMPAVTIKPSGSKHSKLFKLWLKAWRLPPWLRNRAGLLMVEGQPAAVVLPGEIKYLHTLPSGWSIEFNKLD